MIKTARRSYGMACGFSFSLHQGSNYESIHSYCFTLCCWLHRFFWRYKANRSRQSHRDAERQSGGRCHRDVYRPQQSTSSLWHHRCARCRHAENVQGWGWSLDWQSCRDHRKSETRKSKGKDEGNQEEGNYKPSPGETPPPVIEDLLPAKYKLPGTSGLTADVKSGKNEFTFDLSDK